MTVTSAVGNLFQSIFDVLAGILHSCLALLQGVWSIIFGLLKAGLATAQGLLSVLWCKCCWSLSLSHRSVADVSFYPFSDHSQVSNLAWDKTTSFRKVDNTADIQLLFFSSQSLPLLLVIGGAILIYQIFVVDKGRAPNSASKVGAGRKKVA